MYFDVEEKIEHAFIESITNDLMNIEMFRRQKFAAFLTKLSLIIKKKYTGNDIWDKVILTINQHYSIIIFYLENVGYTFEIFENEYKKLFAFFSNEYVLMNVVFFDRRTVNGVEHYEYNRINRGDFNKYIDIYLDSLIEMDSKSILIKDIYFITENDNRIRFSTRYIFLKENKIVNFYLSHDFEFIDDIYDEKFGEGTVLHRHIIEPELFRRSISRRKIQPFRCVQLF